MKKSSVATLVAAAVFVTAVLTWFFVGRSHLDKAGGAYAVSPDGRWLAEISDAHSTVHKRAFAVIQLWDLDRYPSLREGIRFYGNKAPTMRFEFPQDFYARDQACEVTWETNSTEFIVEFQSNVPSGTASQLQRFRYDLTADTFSLSKAPDR